MFYNWPFNALAVAYIAILLYGIRAPIGKKVSFHVVLIVSTFLIAAARFVRTLFESDWSGVVLVAIWLAIGAVTFTHARMLLARHRPVLAMPNPEEDSARHVGSRMVDEFHARPLSLPSAIYNEVYEHLIKCRACRRGYERPPSLS